MAVLKDLIVHGASRFLNGAYFKTINAESIGADAGIFNKLIATSLDAKTATIDDLTAKNATVTALLDVQGELHTNSWSNANIATIDGSFYISPTSSSADGSDVDASDYTPTGTITYNNGNYTKLVVTGTFNTSQLNLGDATNVAWPANSYIIITGDVLVGNEWYPLGTIRGKLQYQLAADVNSKSITVIPIGAVIIDGDVANTSLTDGHGLKPQTLEAIRIASSAAVNGSTTLKMRKIKVSMTSYGGTYQSPIGIFMTAMGSNKKTFLDIYGGSNNTTTIPSGSGALARPVLRIGNLSGLEAVGNVTPSGWGIYTTNGFFTGTIVAKQGKIGDGTAAWTIGNDGDNRAYIWSGIQNITSTGSTTGVYVGTNGISNYQSTTQYVNITGGKITAQGVDISGKIVASSGTIGGWTINSSYGIYTNSKTSATSTSSGILIQKDGGIYAGAYNSTSQACPFQVTSAGALTATNAQIFGDLTANTLTVGASGDSNHLIYSGGTIDLSTDWLKFDSSTQTVLIGKKVTTTSLQTKIDSDTFWITNGIKNIAYIGNENKTITDTFVSDGVTTTFELSSSVANGSQTIISPSSVIVTRSGKNLTVTSGLPIEGQSFTYTYTPSDAVTYYTMGIRKDGSSIGQYSFAEGKDTTASGSYSHAEGCLTVASGQYSHAEGNMTIASGNYSHAEGNRTTASGYYSHVEGGATLTLLRLTGNANATTYTLSSDFAAFNPLLLINSNFAGFGGVIMDTSIIITSVEYDSDSYALRSITVSSTLSTSSISNQACFFHISSTSKGEGSHAEGIGVKAIGKASHGEGTFTYAKGIASHAEGNSTSSIGNYSKAGNRHTIAQGQSQTAIGRYNIASGTADSYEDTDQAFIIGNGTDDENRSNALTVNWAGQVMAQGVSYIDGGYHEFFCGDMTAKTKAINSNLTNSSSIQDWISALIKAVCAMYPGKSGGIFKGRLAPSANAYFEFSVYNTSTLSSGMPQYAYGTYRQYPNYLIDFWVTNYVYNQYAIKTS